MVTLPVVSALIVIGELEVPATPTLMAALVVYDPLATMMVSPATALLILDCSEEIDVTV
jgi:hypothetical protein